MKKHILLLSVTLLVMSNCGLAATRPNLIFFLADDQRNDTLGCAGHPIVKTPVIDELARGGVRFANAFVTTSICAASRASLFTGLYERTHRYTFGTPPIAKAFTDRSYPTLLRQAGYRTGFVGKFGVRVTDGARKEMFDYFKPLSRNPYHKPQKDGSLRHLSEIAGDRAIDFINQQTETQPFCLSVSFNAVHAEDSDKINQYAWPQAVDGLYDDVPIPPARLSDPGIYARHPDFLKNSINRERYYWRWDTPDKYQRNLRAYFRMISGIDHVVGRVLKVLKQKGFADNTVIVYSGDNGYFMAQRGFAGKWLHYEESLRVPLIVYDPRARAAQRDRVLDPMALNIDIPATLLNLADVPVPETYQGRSLVPWLQAKTVDDWRTDFFCEHLMEAGSRIPKWEGTRGSRYMYARYFEQRPVYEFLHDLKTDPDQLKNFVNDPQYAGILSDMRARTNELRDAYGGPFPVKPIAETKPPKQPQWEFIFNGSTLEGWKGDPQHWRVENGAIVGMTDAQNPLPHNTFLIWEGKPVRNFELSLMLRMDGNNNSGIQYRSKEMPEKGDYVVGGYQMDIHPNPSYVGMLYEEQGRGIIAQRPTKVLVAPNGKKRVIETLQATPIKLDDWNAYTVLAIGNRLVHKINGKVTAEITDFQSDRAAKSGIIALQLHRGPSMQIRVKDIRLKRLR